MISLDLFKKDDILVLLDCFDLTFLQVPMKRPPKSLLKFIPNGFRPEKLMRAQLNKVYVDALYSREVSLTAYVLNELEQNFQKIGLEKDIIEKKDEKYTVDTYIVEISSVVFENYLVIPAHIVLMLYGIECSEEEKNRSNRLHAALQFQLRETKQQSFEAGYVKGENSVSSELETERKKVAKLNKTIEGLSAPSKAENKEIENLKAEKNDLIKKTAQQANEINELSNTVKELNKKIDSLKILSGQQEEKIKSLTVELRKKENELKEVRQQIDILNEDKENVTKVSFEQSDIMEICVNAIELFKYQSKENILEIAKAKFSENVNVKDAWRNLCDDSLSLIGEIYELLLNNSFDMSFYDKFIELETMLVLESAVEQALKATAHKVMATSTLDDSIAKKITIQ